MTQPRSFMLSYLPAATAATRVRKITCVGLLCAAVTYFVIGIVVALATVFFGYHTAIAWGGPAAPTLAVIWLRTSHTFIYIAISGLFASGLLGLFTAAVYKGHRWPTHFAILLLVPLVLLFCYIAIFGLCVAAFSFPPAPALAWCISIPVFLVSVLLALLTLDIASYLRWLSHRPRDEMPKRPFIPAALKRPKTPPAL